MEYLGKVLRHEIKYFINTHNYYYLRNRLKDIMYKDENGDEDSGYFIRSLYFDDIYNSAFNEKEIGAQIRKKYRVRIYNLKSSIIKLEKKNKYGRYISKESVNLTKKEFYKILNQDYDFLRKKDSKLFLEFYGEIKNNLLSPRVIVDYQREAYICEAGNVRVTFDKELSTGINSYDIFDENLVTQSVFDKQIMIMEVKYDSFMPTHIKDALQISNHQLSAASKYVLCTKVIKKLKL